MTGESEKYVPGESEFATRMQEWAAAQIEMWAELVGMDERENIPSRAIVSLARSAQSLHQVADAIDETGVLSSKLEEGFTYAFVWYAEYPNATEYQNAKVWLVSSNGWQGRIAVWKQGKYTIVEQMEDADGINAWLIDRGEILGLSQNDVALLMLPGHARVR